MFYCDSCGGGYVIKPNSKVFCRRLDFDRQFFHGLTDNVGIAYKETIEFIWFWHIQDNEHKNQQNETAHIAPMDPVVAPFFRWPVILRSLTLKYTPHAAPKMNTTNSQPEFLGENI